MPGAVEKSSMDFSWDDHSDVVIIGSGAAGLAAAIEARQASDAIDWTRSLGVRYTGRLGGCALTECIVFGRIAGRNAAKGPDIESKENTWPE